MENSPEFKMKQMVCIIKDLNTHIQTLTKENKKLQHDLKHLKKKVKEDMKSLVENINKIDI